MSAPFSMSARKPMDPPNQDPSTRRVPDSSKGEKSFVSVRGVKVTGPGGRGGISRRGECQHQRGGYCLLHGGGAMKLFRPHLTSQYLSKSALSQVLQHQF